MSESSSHNSGGIFSVGELKILMAWKWTKESGICFVNWILLRFQFITMLFCALRTENYERFRQVNLEGLKFHRDHRERGQLCPLMNAHYNRVKNRKGDEEQQGICVVCLCKNGIHKPIEFEVDINGNPKGEVKGNVFCWLGELDYCIKDASPGKKLFCYYNKRAKKFGNTPIEFRHFK